MSASDCNLRGTVLALRDWCLEYLLSHREPFIDSLAADAFEVGDLLYRQRLRPTDCVQIDMQRAANMLWQRIDLFHMIDKSH